MFRLSLEEQYHELETSKERTGAWDHFLELGLPSRQMEKYQYIKFSKLYGQRFLPSFPTKVEFSSIEPHILPECRDSLLVFVNGHFQPELSLRGAISNRVVITTLKQASQTYNAFLSNYRAKHLKRETDPFAAANAALNCDGAFIYLPPKTCVEPPVQILHLIDTGEDPMFMHPRLHLFAGSQSKIDLVCTTATLSGTSWFSNGVVEMAVEEAAQVHVTQSLMGESEDSWHFSALRANLKRDSKLNCVSVTDGSRTVRQDYHVTLAGENAEGFLNGVWHLKENKESHTHVFMEHKAPHCRSRQVFKGALHDRSRSSFEGKIYVHSAAQKTDAFQLNQNILLGEGANADCKPNLEIFADDVKASHGATVGRLDMEQVHYMQTRGISEKAAKDLLIQGFCNEIVEMIPVASLRHKLSE